jgi:hypothetical protein
VPRKEKSDPARLDGALEEGLVPEAWDAAKGMAVVPLGRALWLTMLLAKDNHPQFEPVSRRFLERFLREEKPSTEAVYKTAYGLHELHRASPLLEMAAWKGLMDLVDQIERRRRRLTE